MPLKAAKEKLLRMLQAYDGLRNMSAWEWDEKYGDEFGGFAGDTGNIHRAMIRQMALVLALMP